MSEENTKNLKFEVSVDEANTLLTGLGELPAKYSASLIQKLQNQAAPQIQVTESNDGKQLLTEA